MNKTFLIAGAISGALAVLLGAFGAHGLKAKVSSDTLQIFETAVRYQFYHVFALLAVGFLYLYIPSGSIIWSGRLFIAGTVIFSGSLYALTFTRAAGSESFNWLGAITPIGGTCFIAGWICMAIALAQYKPA